MFITEWVEDFMAVTVDLVGQATTAFGWMMWCVRVMRQVYTSVDIMDGVLITVTDQRLPKLYVQVYILLSITLYEFCYTY